MNTHDTPHSDDQRFYDIVAEELQRKVLKPGVWARAIAETGGEGEAARAHYIRLRVAELASTEEAEVARKAAQERDKKQKQADEALEEIYSSAGWAGLITLVIILCILAAIAAANCNSF